MGQHQFVGADGSSIATVRTRAVSADVDRASRRWRAIWRTHFYAGVFAAPVLVMLALTGLVILYTQPIQDLTQHQLRRVADTGTWQSFGRQESAVTARYPGAKVTSVVPPKDATSSTEFGLSNGRSVFVDPYTSAVLGTADPNGGIVGLANRLHGGFDNDTLKIKLPAIAGLLGSGPIMQEFEVGSLLLEIFAGWAIVLVVSGLYLWWPRRTTASRQPRDRSWFRPRLGKAGRARWRDLHAIPGVFAALGILFVLTTGLFWSSYWGTNFTAFANKVTPNRSVDAPNSGTVKLGDLDRLNHKINWNTADHAVADSTTPHGTSAAPVSLDTVVTAAKQEGMLPGYSISYPVNGRDDVGNPTYGSFTLANSWPRKTSEAKTVYLDQFTGTTISRMNIYGNGGVSVASDTLVSTHMGTELGLWTRILMTGICLAVLWSVLSSVVMYVKRRRPGSAGLPRRPRDLRIANGLIALMIVVGFVYPLWGVSALAVLSIDRLVIRRIPRLRAAFGQR